MAGKEIKVLHVDTERGWHNEQQQLGSLVELLQTQGVKAAIVCHPKAALRRFAKRHKITHYSVEMKGEMDFIAGLHIAFLAARHGYRILHLHTGRALAIGIWAKLFNHRLKLVTNRRIDNHLPHRKWRRFKYDNQFLDKIICHSDRIKEVLLEDRIPGNRLVTIRTGIDLKKYDNDELPITMREQFAIPHDHIIVGTVAVLERYKDYPILIRAAEIVTAKLKNVTFLAVGDGHQKRLLEVMAKSVGLQSSFIFAGFRDNIGHFYKTFDMYIHASHLEGSGTSLLEAMSVGLPVIATSTGGIPEIIHSGQNGMLFPVNSASELAKVIIQLCEDSALRKSLGQNARESVQKYSLDTFVDKHLRLYEGLL